MLDSIVNLRIADMELHRLRKEMERGSEARRSSTLKPEGSLTYDLWLARLGDMLINLGMKLKASPGTHGYGPGMNIG